VLLFPEHRLFASAAVPLAARPVIAVAGGIDAVKAARYAAAGADVIVTSWPYYASPRDVQVRFSSTEFEQNAVAPARVFP
jgi:molybdenum transport protein